MSYLNGNKWILIDIIKTLKGSVKLIANGRYIAKVRFCIMVMVVCKLLTTLA